MNVDLQESAAQVASSRRILIMGSSGSGKTTLAIKLAHLLGLTVIHLDAHFWKPGWVATPQSEWRSRVVSLVQTESWVMDGTYENSLDLRIPSADCIILVMHSRWICLWRVLKRKFTVDDQRRPDAPSGQKLDLAFLRYVWRYPSATHPGVVSAIEEYGPETPTITLTGGRQIRRFSESVGQAVRDVARENGQPMHSSHRVNKETS